MSVHRHFIFMEGVLVLFCSISPFSFSSGDKTIANRTLFHASHPDSLSPTVEIANQNINTATNFPDPNFRAVAENYMGVSPGGVFSAEKAARKNAAWYCYFNKIESLEGIQFFTALTVFDCSGNKITQVDVSKNTALAELGCGGNRLTVLDVSKNAALTTLGCGGNQLTGLDLSKNIGLQKLYCYDNRLKVLNVSKNAALTYLDCSYNQLPSLDISNSPALKTLYCYCNQLTALDVSKNPALIDMQCCFNQLISVASMLKLPNLQTLDIRYNYLDCKNWSDVQTLIKRIGEPVYDTYDSLLSGAVYSPQKAFDPYKCGQTEISRWKQYEKN